MHHCTGVVESVTEMRNAASGWAWTHVVVADAERRESCKWAGDKPPVVGQRVRAYYAANEWGYLWYANVTEDTCPDCGVNEQEESGRCASCAMATVEGGA